MHRKWISIVLATAFAAVASAPSWAADKPMTAQQERMKSCNAKAVDKKGDDRKAFMKTCLSGEEQAAKSKMSTCNTQAKGMKGDEHKKFMSDCMKKAA
ncbi:MAG: PsiF family protein, partial [Casimicrobiaceae bacterium]